MRIVRNAAVGEMTLLLPTSEDGSDVIAALQRALRVCVGNIAIDPVARTARCGVHRLPLTPREFALLALLAQAAGAIVTRTAILDAIWDTCRAPTSNLVEVHMSRLRAKLADAGAALRIETLRQSGWRLSEIDAEPAP